MQPFPVYEDCSELVAGKSIYVRIHETSTPVMWNFHIHSHYEITFILEGNVSVLLPEQIHTGTEMRVVMLRPYTQHYMIPDENQLYRRANISFTEEYVSHMPVEWNALRSVFPENGAILLPDMEEAVRLEQILTVLEKEGESYGGARGIVLQAVRPRAGAEYPLSQDRHSASDRHRDHGRHGIP